MAPGSIFRKAQHQFVESGAGKAPDYRLSLESAKTLFANLTSSRLELLDTLRRIVPCTPAALARVEYKTLTEREPRNDIGKLVLAIPAFIADLTAPLVRQAMESVHMIDVEAWADQHLGASMLAKRRRALISPVAQT